MPAPVHFPARKQQADDTRARLLDVAWDMVRADGPAAFSMRQLAAQAKVAVGLPFAYFKSKEELLDELRIRYWDSIEVELSRGLGGKLPARRPSSFEALARRGLTLAVQYALREPNLYNLIALNPGATLSEAVFVRELKTAQPFVELLSHGQEAGEFVFSGDPTVFALALWTSLQGYIERMGARLPRLFRPYQERVFDEILEAFFSRIRRTPARTPRKRK